MLSSNNDPTFWYTPLFIVDYYKHDRVIFEHMITHYAILYSCMSTASLVTVLYNIIIPKIWYCHNLIYIANMSLVAITK